MRVAAAGSAELSTAFTLRTGLSMTAVGNLISPYLELDGNNVVSFNTEKLLREGSSSALGAAIESQVVTAQGRRKTRTVAHVKKGLDTFRNSLTAAPLSNVMAIEDYRIEPLHAVLNCINGLWLTTAAYYEQLIGKPEGSFAAAMLVIGIERLVTSFNGKECQEVVDRRAEVLVHLSQHPMHGVLVRVWSLMHTLLWTVNVVEMERHTPAHLATFAECAAQYEHYHSKYLSQPFPSPAQHDLTILAPTCGAKEHPLVSMTVKQYDHALMHHALGQLMAEAFSIASAGSSWLEAGNKRWKRAINFHTSLGGGWEGERRDQLRQVLERVCVECHPDISKYVIPIKSYLCGVCKQPKLGHTCTAKVQQRLAAVMAADARSPTAELLPPLPCHCPGYLDPSDDAPSPPSSPPVYSPSHGEPSYPTPLPPFLASPNKSAMLAKLMDAVEATFRQDPTILLPTQEDYMLVAKVAIHSSLFEQHLLNDGLVVIAWVEKERAKLESIRTAKEAIDHVNMSMSNVSVSQGLHFSGA